MRAVRLKYWKAWKRKGRMAKRELMARAAPRAIHCHNSVGRAAAFTAAGGAAAAEAGVALPDAVSIAERGSVSRMLTPR